MNFLGLVTDAYERKARLYPAILLLLPLVAVTWSFAPALLSGLRSLAAIAAACGGAFFLAQVARDSGKRREKGLFESWGGPPSTAILRHRDPRLSPVTKSRYHSMLAALVKGTSAPDPEDEKANPLAADATYAAWADFLRVRTRDTKKYALLFHELISYGYRRNVWGLRPAGLSASALSAAVTALFAVREWQTSGVIATVSTSAAVGCVALMGFWWLLCTPAWVRIPADAYAQRLAESVESLAAPATSRTKRKG